MKTKLLAIFIIAGLCTACQSRPESQQDTDAQGSDVTECPIAIPAVDAQGSDVAECPVPVPVVETKLDGTGVSSEIKPPVYAGGHNALCRFFAKEAWFDNRFLDHNWIKFFCIYYVVGTDCSISFKADCFRDNYFDYFTEEDIKAEAFMKAESKRVIGKLKYEKPAMRFNSATKEWEPTEMELCEIVRFNYNSAPTLYDKNALIDELEHYVDLVGCDRLSYCVYKKLRQLTTDKEKIKLAKRSSSYEVRVNAILGLEESENPACKSLLPSLLADTTTLWVCDDDVVYPISVSNFYYSIRSSSAEDKHK